MSDDDSMTKITSLGGYKPGDAIYLLSPKRRRAFTIAYEFGFGRYLVSETSDDGIEKRPLLSVRMVDRTKATAAEPFARLVALALSMEGGLDRVIEVLNVERARSCVGAGE